MPVAYFNKFDATSNGESLFWVPHLKQFLKNAKRRGIYVFIRGTAETFSEFQLQLGPRVRELDVCKDGAYLKSCKYLKPVIKAYWGSDKTLTKRNKLNKNF